MPSIEAVTRALDGFTIVGECEPAELPWMGGPGVTVAMRPEVNGYVVVDLVDKPWPDHMGDPKDEVDLFGVWSMGWFGPYTFPGGLARAIEQAHHLDPAIAARAREHRAFVRIKSSYVLGAGEDALLRPEDYDALEELQFVTRVARAVLATPGASFYFNPNGEVLYPVDGLGKAVDALEAKELPPLPAWSNIRMLTHEEAPDWRVMDTVGMQQLGVIDHEACVPIHGFEPNDIVTLLRSVTYYTLEHGPIINDGDTMDGPGGVWKAHHTEDSLASPPRPVVRWRPLAADPAPECFGFPSETESRS